MIDREPKIDCFIEGKTGLWLLEQLEDKQIGNVMSHDSAILNEAKRRKLRTPGSKVLELESGNSPVLLSIQWSKVFKPEFLSRYQCALNLHQGILPQGRGTHSAFWALWNQMPAGATLHLIDEGIDTGPIVAQKTVKYHEAITLAELISEIENVERSILDEILPDLLNGNLPKGEAQEANGSYYAHNDYVNLVRNVRDNWKNMQSADLVRLLQCMTALPIKVDDRYFNLSAQLLAD